MDYHPDFAELCALLNANGVEFLIVGGYAVAFHGAPRFTGDPDLFIRPAADHIERLLQALRQFGFPTAGVTTESLLGEGEIIELGRAPVQIRIMSRITGVSWEQAWASRQPGSYGDVSVQYIGFQALLTNKRAVGRTKDLADIEALGQ